MTELTPAVLVTGSDENGNEWAFFKIYDGRWCDAYNERETSPEFIQKYVFPNVRKVYFSDLVMSGMEWVENGCPMSMTDEQMEQYKEARQINEWLAFEELDGRTPEQDEHIKQYFGDVEITTSDEWRKRHL